MDEKLLEIAAEITKAAIGPAGGIINNPDGVAKFLEFQAKKLQALKDGKA